MCISCLKFLVKVKIAFNQCKHISQVEPFKKTHFLVGTSGNLLVDVSYGGSFLWRNNVFSMGTLYSNAYGD
jgi:hypothetical protein